MPFGYESTALWRGSLSAHPDDQYSEARQKLSIEYHRFRERAAILAAEIPQDLRDYTVHDVTHLDALWELADQIGGGLVDLTPTEAFVLGGAFLVHDLGMGLAALPGGLEQLKTETEWRDAVAAAIFALHGRHGSADEISVPAGDVVKKASEDLLRARHASRAATLALVNWPSATTGVNYALIENPELRARFGALIGEIAASHGWDLDEVARTFGPRGKIGAPIDCPDEWTVDPLKLACLMRLADAAHLDERRAPGFLRAIRRPGARSDQHWSFQGHLHRPRREGDRLVYTSANPFEPGEASAWWACYDALKMVDGELRRVDAFLADQNHPRFAVRSVKGVEDVRRLAELIPTAGWQPVNAEISVTNVPSLVRKLGGESLYGGYLYVALRELIQNARDAMIARCELLKCPKAPVEVSLTHSDDGWWLTVSDAGIGMSKTVLTETLLDFGNSYWGSGLMRSESPGLAGSGFRATGRYGIGFFSIFMLGSNAKITTRRFDEGSSDTRVLEFSNGVWDRPLYRLANRDEQKHSGGTSISVLLDKDPESPGGLLAPDEWPVFSLAELCGYICPAFDCEILVTQGDGPACRAVAAGDWLTASPVDLFKRVGAGTNIVFPNATLPASYVADRMREVVVGGEVVARASLAPSPPAALTEDGVVNLKGAATVGGLLAHTQLGGVVGLFQAEPKKADRMSAGLLATSEALASWATEQAILWSDLANFQIRESNYTEMDGLADVVFRLGGETGPMIVCRNADNHMNMMEFEVWAAGRDQILVYNRWVVDIRGVPGAEEVWLQEEHSRITLGSDVILTGAGGRYGNWDNFGDNRPDKSFEPPRGTAFNGTPHAWFYHHQLDREAGLLRAIARAWDEPLETLLERLQLFGYNFIPGIGTSIYTGEVQGAQGTFLIRRA